MEDKLGAATQQLWVWNRKCWCLFGMSFSALPLIQPSLKGRLRDADFAQVHLG